MIISEKDFRLLLGAWVEKLVASTGRRPRAVPHAGQHGDLGEPFYRICDDQLSYEAWERGSPILQRRTADPDELLYWIVDDLAWNLAIAWAMGQETYNSIDDTRRLWFPVWQATMYALKPSWGRRTEAHIREVLDYAPFREA